MILFQDMSLSEWSIELFIFKPLWLVYIEYEYDGILVYIVPLSMLDFIYRKDHLFSVATGKFYHSKED